jgi:hypothetical protein
MRVEGPQGQYSKSGKSSEEQYGMVGVAGAILRRIPFHHQHHLDHVLEHESRTLRALGPQPVKLPSLVPTDFAHLQELHEKNADRWISPCIGLYWD